MPAGGTLALGNVQLGRLNVGQNTSDIGARGVGVNGYEQLTLESNGTATNTIGTLNLPMDTGTDGKLTITGDASIVLGGRGRKAFVRGHSASRRQASVTVVTLLG